MFISRTALQFVEKLGLIGRSGSAALQRRVPVILFLSSRAGGPGSPTSADFALVGVKFSRRGICFWSFSASQNPALIQILLRPFRNNDHGRPNTLTHDRQYPSLVALGSVAFQAVDHARLGGAQRDPVLHVPLQRNVKLLHGLARLLMNGVGPVELCLEGKLSHQ